MTGTKQIVTTSLAVTAGTIALAELRTNDELPGVDQWVGLVLAFMVIGALADFGVPLAGGFAVLTMLAVLLSRGDQALGFAGDRLKQERAKTQLRRSRTQRPGRAPSRSRSPRPSSPGSPATLSPDDPLSRPTMS